MAADYGAQRGSQGAARDAAWTYWTDSERCAVVAVAEEAEHVRVDGDWDAAVSQGNGRPPGSTVDKSPGEDSPAHVVGVVGC